jgi:hypothetical protein
MSFGFPRNENPKESQDKTASALIPWLRKFKSRQPPLSRRPRRFDAARQSARLDMNRSVHAPLEANSPFTMQSGLRASVRARRQRRLPQIGRARNREGAPLRGGSWGTAKYDSGKSGVRFLDRSKRGTGFRTASLLVERNKEGDGFVRFRWGETKELEADGGARLMIVTGAEFPIGLTVLGARNARHYH